MARGLTQCADAAKEHLWGTAVAHQGFGAHARAPKLTPPARSPYYTYVQAACIVPALLIATFLRALSAVIATAARRL